METPSGVLPVPIAGFVLAGGKSSRMGRDKAVLPVGNKTLIEHVAQRLFAVTQNVTIIADPGRYARFGMPVIPDDLPGSGPLGGVVTALRISTAPWNLIVACDMPNIDGALLHRLVDVARTSSDGWHCVAPLGPTGPEPLCAIYHRDALGQLRHALDRNVLAMRAALRNLEVKYITIEDPRNLNNINTPEDWAAHG